ncbi:MAG: Na(+)-translocating NADH:ubiquinone reductase subunit C [Bacteroidaceae bacterium]|nr:Na(+)-translocating NADH:ubiquinone reductase subunit C [Bacteroidaceae bacterium]
MATNKYVCKICGYVHEGDSAPEKCPQCQQTDCLELVGAPAKKGLNTNSNVYTVVYAAVMVVIVAFLLAFVASALKPAQDANVARDTKNQILTSLNIVGLSGEAIDAKYGEVITKEIAKDSIWEANVDGAVKYVLAVKGRGLWGGLWGYVSVNDDKTSVFGTYFSHESETAGLGARINERWFQEQFNGKPIFDEAGNVALTVVKAGASTKETEIDGVTGATLTSKGVASMVNDGLKGYESFLKGAVEAEADTTAVATDSLTVE